MNWIKKIFSRKKEEVKIRQGQPSSLESISRFSRMHSDSWSRNSYVETGNSFSGFPSNEDYGTVSHTSQHDSFSGGFGGGDYSGSGGGGSWDSSGSDSSYDSGSSYDSSSSSSDW